MNIWHTPDLERYLIENHLMDTGFFNKTMLVHSHFLSSKVLPALFKEIVTDKIKSHQQWLNDQGIKSASWDEVIDFMISEDHSHLLQQFVDYTRRLDLLRNENSVSVFPELQGILC